MLNAQKILVLAPHTDDAEIGCGGTIARLIEEGKQLYTAAFSTARESVPKGFPEDILESEVRQAGLKLGLSAENILVFDFPVRRFPEYRQDILQKLIDLRREINPEAVFIPSLNDIHQDHQVIAHEGLRAFKRATILAYEEPWNNISFQAQAFIILQARHLAQKISALQQYKSQAHRAYVNEDYIKSLARTRGVQVEADYAEVFETVRWMIR